MPRPCFFPFFARPELATALDDVVKSACHGDADVADTCLRTSHESSRSTARKVRCFGKQEHSGLDETARKERTRPPPISQVWQADGSTGCGVTGHVQS